MLSGKEVFAMEEAATNNYPAPVDKLLTLGAVQWRNSENWLDYKSLGIGPEHVPDLLRIATDMALNNADFESDEVWGPLHAWRALGQLGAVQTIEPLINMREQAMDDDLLIDDLPEVFGVMGPSALPTLTAYSADASHNYSLRVTAIRGIETIGRRWPEVRNECVQIIMHQLELFEENDTTFNAFLISSLGALKATETLPLVEQAFAAHRVDTGVMNWYDVQIEFGLKSEEEVAQERAIALTQERFQPGLWGLSPPTSFSGKSKKHSSSKKSKNKKRKR